MSAIFSKYYYYNERYYVINPVDGGLPMLAVKKSKKAVDDGVDRIIVGLESMWKVCWKIHKQVSHNGVASMEPEAKKFYHNVTRPIIKIFLKYSEIFQTKKNKYKFIYVLSL